MKKIFLPILFFALILSSCKKEEEEEQDNTPTYSTEKQEIKKTYADMAFAVYSDALITATDLKDKIYAFTDNPTLSGFNDVKTSWLAAREVYGQTEIFRFVDGPIDNPSDGPEALINAWPMDEAYVDYVQGNPTSGIINDVVNYPTIDAATLITANENGGEVNISTGFHAIEFIIWGQDLSASSAGVRPYTDFIEGGSGTASNQARRKQYLKVCADVLVAALTQVKNKWDKNVPTSYYNTFVNMDSQTALRKMFNALRVLSGEELAGERIFTAYENANQEDEHSCFSDNTHRDIYLNALGIHNLYTGNYVSIYGNSVSGYALEDLSAIVNPTANTTVLNRMQTSFNLINLMYTPFDQAIILPAERPKVLDAVNSLLQQKTDFETVSASYGIYF